jgi:hypothetical protein
MPSTNRFVTTMLLMGLLLLGATAASGEIRGGVGAYAGKTESMTPLRGGRGGDSRMVRGTVECRSGPATGVDDRTIAIVEPATGGCAVVYTKFGNSHTVATAKHDGYYCTQVREKIQARLETARFQCELFGE